MGSQAEPGLTTVAQPCDEMGRLAAQNILTLTKEMEITKSDYSPKIKGSLIVRESTTKPS